MVTCCCSGSVNNVKYSKLGGDLAKAASDSAHAVNSDENASSILRKGFYAIIADPFTTADERSLAQMGVNFGVVGVSDSDIAEARYAVMDAIALAMPGPIGGVIAGTAITAYQNVWNNGNSCGHSKWNGAKKVLIEGFNAVISHPETTREERVVAQMGLDVGNGLDDIQAVSARLPIMHKIAGLS